MFQISLKTFETFAESDLLLQIGLDHYGLDIALHTDSATVWVAAFVAFQPLGQQNQSTV